MKTTTMYQWTDEDPSIRFISEAYNRLRAFVTNYDDLRAFNSVTKGNQFSEADIKAVGWLLRMLSRRARDKWSKLLIAATTEQDRGYAESIIQAADAAEQAARDLVGIFNEQRSNLITK